MNSVLLTIDVDWAPDFVIDFVAQHLVESRVRATWFITHQSPAVERLRRHPELFELGIHPNFLPGSSHGRTTAEVLVHCMGLVPDAKSMRTHALVQSTPLLTCVLNETPIAYDLSLYLPRAFWARPVEYSVGDRLLVRIPYVWEDDFEMAMPDPDWTLPSICDDGERLTVLDFHPIHIYLNSETMAPYAELKQRHRSLSTIKQEAIDPFVTEGEGTRAAFGRAIARLSGAGERVSEYGGRWQRRA